MVDEVSRDTNYEAAVKVKRHQDLYEAEVWKKLVSTYEGRFVLFSIMGFGDIYLQGGEAPLDVANHNRAEGRREVALQVLQRVLAADDQAYILMQREAGEFQKQLERLLEQQQGEDG